MIQKKIRILYILGTFRTGKKLLGSLLDSNKNFIVWPNEFSFYYLHWLYIKKIKDEKNLKKVIIKHFKVNYIKNNSYFNYNLFKKKILKFRFTKKAEHDLFKLFYVLKLCFKNQLKSKIKYFCLVTPSITFDFSILNEKIDRKIIIVSRNLISSFVSMRNKRLSSKNSFDISIFLRELPRLFYRSLLDFKNHKNIKLKFINIKLENFKLSPILNLKKIYKYCNIINKKNNYKLTRLCYSYQGNFSEKDLNKGVILNKSSNYQLKLTRLENYYIQIFSLLNEFGLKQNKKQFSVSFFIFRNFIIKLSMLFEKKISFIFKIKAILISFYLDFDVLNIYLKIRKNKINRNLKGSFFDFQKQII